MEKNTKIISLLACLLGFFILEGCTPAHMKIQEKFIGYDETQLEESTTKPEVIPDGKPIKVAVTEFSLPNENSSVDYQVARLANLKQYAAEVVNDTITKAGGALVSPGDASKIKTYIQDAEKRGKSNVAQSNGNCEATRGRGRRQRHCASNKEAYNGLSDVDYAMLGEISSVSYGSQTSTTSTKNGSITFCNYSAAISGTLAVYRITKPDVRENSIRFQADDSASTEGACPSGTYNPQIIRSAIEKAINSVKAEYQNNILTVDAYVIGKRVDKDKKSSIFEISAGKNMRLRAGTKVRFMHVEPHENRVKGGMINQETMVGQGIISDKIDSASSWVYVEQDADKGIRMWDISRPFHENCKYLWLCGDH
jgi:hypothetical protein